MIQALKITYCSGMLVDVIPGVDAAVKTMKKGETSLITSDPSHAFGGNGRPEWGIAPDAPVTYEVHLKSFEQVCVLHPLTVCSSMKIAQWVERRS